jgi:hypothetical protein
LTTISRQLQLEFLIQHRYWSFLLFMLVTMLLLCCFWLIVRIWEMILWYAGRVRRIIVIVIFKKRQEKREVRVQVQYYYTPWLGHVLSVIPVEAAKDLKNIKKNYVTKILDKQNANAGTLSLVRLGWRLYSTNHGSYLYRTSSKVTRLERKIFNLVTSTRSTTSSRRSQ